MYAVGHFALGYLVGKFVSKSLNVSINLPLLFFVSVFPDIDILIPFLEHRGPLHSVLVHCLVFVPFFLVYKKRALPYFGALIFHSLIGDFLTGGMQLLWPVSTSLFGFDIMVASLTNLSLEAVLFVVSIVVMFKTKDLLLLFKRDLSNRFLLMPLMAVLLPVFGDFPRYIPVIFLVPHVFYLGIFMVSLFFVLK